MAVTILDRHASEAAFLWMQREHASVAPHYDLADLAKLDERLEANVDALRTSAEEAWPICLRALGMEEPGEFFAAAAVAAERADMEGLAAILDAGGEVPILRKGIIGGLAWLPFERIREIATALLDPECPPALHHLGIGAMAAHRIDPGPALQLVLLSEDLRAKTAACEAIGVLGRRDGASLLTPELENRDEACRFAAASSLVLLGDHAGRRVLMEIAESNGKNAAPAASLVARSNPDVSASGRGVLKLGASGGACRRVAVIAAGALGDPALVPWLIEQTSDPKLARVASESVSMISGLELVRERAVGRRPADFNPGPTDDPADENVEMDDDSALPWPNPVALKTWWSKNARQFPRSTRHLLGKPIEAAWCQQVLRAGTQRQRRAAAVEKVLLQPGSVSFPTSAPARRQLALLGSR
jgi:uncharacterized protein (TIGR02270 family)